MKQFGLLTTSFLLTASLAIYSRNLPVTLTFLENQTRTLFTYSPTFLQGGFQRSLNQVLNKRKNLPFSPMTQDSER